MRRILTGLTLTLILAAMACTLALAHGGEEGQLPTALLKKVFPEAASFSRKPLHLESLRPAIEKALGWKLESHDLHADAFVAVARGRSVGVAWMTDAHIKGTNVDVLVGLDLTGKVVGVALDHSPVAALAQPAFLKQFVGKTAASPLVVGKDIQPATGQKEASAVVARAVRKGVVVLDHAVIHAPGSPSHAH